MCLSSPRPVPSSPSHVASPPPPPPPSRPHTHRLRLHSVMPSCRRVRHLRLLSAAHHVHHSRLRFRSPPRVSISLRVRLVPPPPPLLPATYLATRRSSLSAQSPPCRPPYPAAASGSMGGQIRVPNHMEGGLGGAIDAGHEVRAGWSVRVAAAILLVPRRPVINKTSRSSRFIAAPPLNLRSPSMENPVGGDRA